MPNRREIKGRIASLHEIDGILGAMKNLSLMEIQKLGRYIGMQRRVVTAIERAIADFREYFPGRQPIAAKTFEAFLLLGSERGFCGNFNESIVEDFHRVQQTPGTAFVAVGHKLASRLAEAVVASNLIEGAGVAEELDAVLARLVEVLNTLQREHGGDLPLGLTVVYHDHESGLIKVRRLLPMPDPPVAQRLNAFPPLLNLEPVKLLPKLINQYLFAVLHEVLSSSLLAENQQRLDHMHGAMHRLDDELGELKIKYNALRQEEIIEEIEIILLSTEVNLAG